MSIPSCIRPQRMPKPLVTGPDTGQPSTPLPDGGTVAGADELLLGLPDLLGERSALLLERVDLGERRLAIVTGSTLASPTCPARGDERIAAGDEPRDDSSLLAAADATAASTWRRLLTGGRSSAAGRRRPPLRLALTREAIRSS